MALGRMTFDPGQRVGMLDGLGGQMWLVKHFALHRGRDPHVFDDHDLHFADGRGLCVWEPRFGSVGEQRSLSFRFRFRRSRYSGKPVSSSCPKKNIEATQFYQ